MSVRQKLLKPNLDIQRHKRQNFGTGTIAKWDKKIRQTGFKSFNTIARTMIIHYKNTLNYFDNRSTNASAESFNAKIKAFRAQLRGEINVDFFLFRLRTLFA